MYASDSAIMRRTSGCLGSSGPMSISASLIPYPTGTRATRLRSRRLLKNREMEIFLVLAGRCWGRRGGVGCNFLVWCWVYPDAGWLSDKQFGNADQVIGDQIEQEVGGDASDATMFGLAHGAMLLAPSEDALDHRPARLRHAIALMPGRSFIDGTGAGLAGFGDGLVLCHMRRYAD